MFVIPALVTMAAGGGVAGIYGLRAALNPPKGVDFYKDLGFAVVGLCVFVTGLHSLVA